MDNSTFLENLDKQETKKKTKKILKKIGKLQNKMMAEGKHSLLIVFQGLDASGKDGVTKALLKYCNPIGIGIKSYKKPTEEEYSHDYLWRIKKNLPASGNVEVFIRSHYEDILVPTVLNLFPTEQIESRYSQINDFEQELERNGTKVLKFFLNVSKEAQEKRLMERVENKKKYWKHKDGDWETRKKFDEYLNVYQSLFTKCNLVPWHNIPADKNWQKTFFTSQIVLDALESMDLKWPKLESELFKNI